MRVGVIGSGAVGGVLPDGFLEHGHEVMRGSRDPAKLPAWKAAGRTRSSSSGDETALPVQLEVA